MGYLTRNGEKENSFCLFSSTCELSFATFPIPSPGSPWVTVFFSQKLSLLALELKVKKKVIFL